MEDSRKNARSKSKRSGNSYHYHPEDCFCAECRREINPRLATVSERAAPGSGAASEPVPEYVACLPYTPPPEEGAESCNTAPSNLQSPLLSFDDHGNDSDDRELETGGFDWLSLSCYGTFEDDFWGKLRELLHKAQLAAKSNNLLESFVTLAPDVIVEVAPHGFGKGFSYCTWKFFYQGMTFGVADRRTSLDPDSKREYKNLSIDIPSMPLMAWTEMGLYDELRKIFQSLGYKPVHIKPSRADFCVDLVDVPICEFVEHMDRGCVVTDCLTRKTHIRNDQIETMHFGSPKSPIQMRIYEKLIEAWKNSVKLDLLVENRWGKFPEKELGATRVEFQLRRPHLFRQHSVNTFQDLIEKRASIAKWLTSDWFRLTEREPDPNHTERFGPNELWKKVIDAFAGWTGPVLAVREKREIRGGDIVHLTKQGYGCLKAVLAHLADFPADENEAEQKVFNLLQHYFKKLPKEVRVKREKLEAQNPYLKRIEGEPDAA